MEELILNINRKNLLKYIQLKEICIYDPALTPQEISVITISEFANDFRIADKWLSKSLVLSPGFLDVLDEIHQFIAKNLSYDLSHLLMEINVTKIKGSSLQANSNIVIGVSSEEITKLDWFYEADPFVLIVSLKSHIAEIVSNLSTT